MAGPRINHCGGTNPSARFRVEELGARTGDSVDIRATGDQYPGIVQKGRGVGDVFLEQMGCLHPFASVDCLGSRR